MGCNAKKKMQKKKIGSVKKTQGSCRYSREPSRSVFYRQPIHDGFLRMSNLLPRKNYHFRLVLRGSVCDETTWGPFTLSG